jgi:hypothetical protein
MASRWGEVSRRWDYRKPEKTARGKVICGAECRTEVQNEVGTDDTDWHKSDTAGSQSVRNDMGLETKTAAPIAVGNGGAVRENIAPSAYPKATEEAIQSAAIWYSVHRNEIVGSVFPVLRARFSMGYLDCIEVTKRAHALRYGSAT